jgi:hypothetical protein
MKYSKEETIIAIKTFADSLGKTPSSRDYRKYKIKPSITVVQNLFGSWSSALEQANLKPITIIKYSKEDVITAIISYYKINGKIPGYNDLSNPGSTTAEKHFGSWNKAIIAAGFTPNESGFGVFTEGKDGHTYRSAAEAYFCDNFLYNRYEYIIEPKYPEPYNKYYDWYVPTLDLYVELDGELRPEAVKNKITINKELRRNCIIITVKDMYKITNPNFLEEWCYAR